MGKAKTATSSVLLLLAVALLATTCSARTLSQEDPPYDAAPLAMAAASSADPSALPASAAAASAPFCPCMEPDAAAVAAAAACGANASCTDAAEFPEEAARWVAAYYMHNKLWPPKRSQVARSATLSKLGADGQPEDASAAAAAAAAAAGGVVAQGVYSVEYQLYPFKFIGSIDTNALTVTGKAQVKILFWWKTIGSININAAKPCITLGYPKIVGMSLCLDLAARALVMDASIMNKHVTKTLIRW